MRILFLNQYFPPDPAPTGILFGEIADALRLRGHEPVFVDSGAGYRDGQGKGGRLIREFIALGKMLFRGLFQKRVEVVVSGSSPPCLAFVGMLVSWRHRAAHLHWCMDVYPEIAVALNELNNRAIAGIIAWLVGFSYRMARAVVGLDADMVSVLSKYRVHPLECRPWVPLPLLVRMPKRPSVPPSPWVWLYSGNLGRAHDWQTLLAAQTTLEERGVDATLVFQGGGPSREAAIQRAEELKLKRVVWRPYAPEAELCTALLKAQCLVVTELPHVQGLLWPSKLALLLGLPRPILFVGPKQCAIAQLLAPHSQAGVFHSGDFRAVADWIQTLRESTDTAATQKIMDVTAHRDSSLAWWVELIERAQRR